MATSLKETLMGNLLNRFNLLSGQLVWLRVFQNEPFKRWIMDLVRQDQLFKKGIDEDGDVIGEYSEYTEIHQKLPEHITHYMIAVNFTIHLLFL